MSGIFVSATDGEAKVINILKLLCYLYNLTLNNSRTPFIVFFTKKTVLSTKQRLVSVSWTNIAWFHTRFGICAG